MVPPRNDTTYHAEGIYHLAAHRIFFSAHESEARTAEIIAEFPTLFFFSSVIPETYVPFCDDFGPVQLEMVVRFCLEMREKVEHPKLQSRRLVFYAPTEPDHLTNAAFLLSCYLMLEHDFSPEQAAARFDRILGLPIEPFRDATWEAPTFRLSILDCLRGLHRAMSLGWFDADDFDVAGRENMYEQPHYDISSITPKFVAFACPRERPDQSHTVARRPADHAEPFKGLGVTDVVRLNEDLLYDDQEFAHHVGVQHHVLEFPDCTVPPMDVVDRFLDVCNTAEGVVAVHCLAGLGRTGTLIACHMIRHSGFTAKEAIGYIRLCRPGSIIGPQQHFLEEYELHMLGDDAALDFASLCSEMSGAAALVDTAVAASESGGVVQAGERGDRVQEGGCGGVRVEEEARLRMSKAVMQGSRKHMQGRTASVTLS